MTPRPGQFIREVQGFAVSYCLEVVQVLDVSADYAPGVWHITTKRWGLAQDGQPFDDGHHDLSYYASGINPVGSKAWRIQHQRAFTGRPVYWVQIDLKPKAGTQIDLFW